MIYAGQSVYNQNIVSNHLANWELLEFLVSLNFSFKTSFIKSSSDHFLPKKDSFCLNASHLFRETYFFQVLAFNQNGRCPCRCHRCRHHHCRRRRSHCCHRQNASQLTDVSNRRCQHHRSPAFQHLSWGEETEGAWA